MTNDRKVLAALPDADCSPKFKDIEKGDLPVDRALGMEWHTETDCFQFSVGTTVKLQHAEVS